MDKAVLVSVLDEKLVPTLRSCFPAKRRTLERRGMRNAGHLLQAQEATIVLVGRENTAAELAWHLGNERTEAGVLFLRAGEQLTIADVVSAESGPEPPMYPDLIEVAPVPLVPIHDDDAHSAVHWLAQRLAPHRYAVVTMPEGRRDGELYRGLRSCLEWFRMQQQ